MAGKSRYSEQEMIDALTLSKGAVYLAAKALGCSHDTVERFIKRYPRVAAACATQRGLMLDEAELHLWRAVRAGEPWAVCFCLSRLGKSRGYTLQVVQQRVSDLTGLSDLLTAGRNGVSHD